MLRRSFLAAAVAAALTGCAAPTVRANVAGNLAEIQIIDRTTGAALPIHWHNGRRFVAGTPGNRYAVSIRNRGVARVLAVVAVDGVNAVTGETAAWDQNGYVFSGGQHWEIRGWRKSQDRIAAFEFTSLPNSYAARTGRPDHVGVIGVAVFREAVKAHPQPVPSQRYESSGAPANETRASAESPASAAPADSVERRRDSAKLGTGHGRNESSWVSYTDFERARPAPDEVITIHYDSRDNLIAMGVLPSPRLPAPAPSPFPGSVGFVPDPPR